MNPVDKPLSLMHLGYNTSAAYDAWRPWMLVGTFTGGDGSGADMYTGINTTNLFNSEAVINWGFTPSTLTNGTTGTRMRFIFTTTQGGVLKSGTASGLEAGHFWSDGNNPRLGVGDFQSVLNGPLDPNNTVEIKASGIGAGASPYWAWGAGNGTSTSGLRLTRLTSNSIIVPNGINGVVSTKVLTVDQNGDVVLTNGLSNGFGTCAAPTLLSSDAVIDLNTWNFYFTRQGTKKNMVGIGIPCTSALFAKLDVLQASGNTASIGIQSTNSDVNGIGLKAVAIGGTTGPFLNVAGWFESVGFSGPASFGAVAIFVPQGKGVTNLGYPIPNDPNGTIGTLNVNGSEWINGGVVSASDSTLKQNIQPLNNSLDKMIHLRPITFSWDTIRDSLMAGTHAGFISQEVERIIPELVRNTGTTKGIAYMELIPHVVKAIQQQQLSIDSLRNKPSGSSLGNICGGTANPLANNYEIPLNGKNFLFKGDGNFGIGNIGSCTPDAKLQVAGTTTSGEKLFSLYSTDLGNERMHYTQGQFFVAANNHYFYSSGSSDANMWLFSDGPSSYFPTLNFGGGGYGGTSPSAANTTLKITGANVPQFESLQSSMAWMSLNLGVGPSFATAFPSPSFALNVGGNSNFNGDINGSGAFNYVSDQQFKNNIDSISNASTIIAQLKPRSFYFDTTNTYGINFNSRKQYGLIAQDVQIVLPELVSTIVKPALLDSAGNTVTAAVTYKNLNYNAFIALLIKNNQELEKRVATLEGVVNSCCSTGAKTSQGGSKDASVIDIELSNADAIVLNQNVPNPFAEQTTISYNIPQNVLVAQILFYDVNGRQIKAVEITKKGKGALNVYANDLSNGIYSYTLIADGKIIETKKMLKQQ